MALDREIKMAVVLFFLYLLQIEFAFGAPSVLYAESMNITPRNVIDTRNETSLISVIDHNGLDITASFQVMIYTGSLSSNTSDAGLKSRQLGRVTYINDCLPVHAFKESRCTPRPHILGSLQSWTKTCYGFVTHYDGQGIPSASSMPQYREDGHCGFEEVCVNTFASPLAGKRGPQVAMCIAKSDFEPSFGRSKSGAKRLLDAVLESVRGPKSTSKQAKIDEYESGESDGSGKNDSGTSRETSSGASISISQVDGQTPMDVNILKLVEWNGAGGLHNHFCRHCSDLEVAKLNADTDHLRLKAQMLTAGAMVGMLWIAIISG